MGTPLRFTISADDTTRQCGVWPVDSAPRQPWPRTHKPVVPWSIPDDDGFVTSGEEKTDVSRSESGLGALKK